jgi:hypothetical protein
LYRKCLLTVKASVGWEENFVKIGDDFGTGCYRVKYLFAGMKSRLQ